MKRIRIRRARLALVSACAAIGSVLVGVLPAAAVPIDGGGSSTAGGASGGTTELTRVVVHTSDGYWIALAVTAVVACGAIALLLAGYLRRRRPVGHTAGA